MEIPNILGRVGWYWRRKRLSKIEKQTRRKKELISLNKLKQKAEGNCMVNLVII